MGVPFAGVGVQPLPKPTASKSTARRLVPTNPNMEPITQFCDVVREPPLPGASPPQVPKPARCALSTGRHGSFCAAPRAPLLRSRYNQPPRSEPMKLGKVIDVVLVFDAAGSGGLLPHE